MSHDDEYFLTADGTPADPSVDWSRWRIFTEDRMVASARWVAAKRRHTTKEPGRAPKVSRSIAARTDIEAHAVELRRLDDYLRQVNPTSATPPVRMLKLAQRVARERLKNDRSRERCMCASRVCGRTLPRQASAKQRAGGAR